MRRSGSVAARGTRTGSRQSYRCAGDAPGAIERRQFRLAYRPKSLTARWKRGIIAPLHE